MQPSDGFWGGVGEAVGSSPGWMVVGALLVVGVLFVVAKYIYPGHKEIKMRELDIRQMEAENARAQVESNRALAEQTRSASAKVDALMIQNAEMTAGMNESKTRSRAMDGKIDRIDLVSSHTESMVEDIHRHFIRPEGTD